MASSKQTLELGKILMDSGPNFSGHTQKQEYEYLLQDLKRVPQVQRRDWKNGGEPCICKYTLANSHTTAY